MAGKKEIKLVPTEEQPYEIPKNWCWTTIESINQYKGHSINPAEHPTEFFELYSVPSSANDYPEITIGADIGSSKQSVEKDDVLLCKINPRINRVWKVTGHTSNSLLASSEWIIIRNNAVNADYLVFLLRAKYFREYMLSNVSGVGGSLMRAQPKFVQTYPIPLAPLAEQKRIVNTIVDLFADLDRAAENAQSIVDIYEQRRAAILADAFAGKLTEQWRLENDVSESTWTVALLKDIVSGFKYGSSEKSDYNNNGTPVLRIPNIGDGEIDFSDLKYFSGEDSGEYQVHTDDILIIRSNGSRDLVGKCALVPELDRKYAYASFLIRIQVSNSILPKFLVNYINSSNAREQLFRRAKSSAGIHNINSKELGSITISLPSLAEQQEIVRILDELLSNEQRIKEAAEEMLDKIAMMKKSILADAFRGKLGTNDPADEPATELLRQILA